MGKGERYMEDFVIMRLRAGDTAWVSPVGGSGYSRLIGPRDTLLRPKQTVQLRSDGDWAEFLYTVHLTRDP